MKMHGYQCLHVNDAVEISGQQQKNPHNLILTIPTPKQATELPVMDSCCAASALTGHAARQQIRNSGKHSDFLPAEKPLQHYGLTLMGGLGGGLQKGNMKVAKRKPCVAHNPSPECLTKSILVTVLAGKSVYISQSKCARHLITDKTLLQKWSDSSFLRTEKASWVGLLSCFESLEVQWLASVILPFFYLTRCCMELRNQRFGSESCFCFVQAFGIWAIALLLWNYSLWNEYNEIYLISLRSGLY